MLPEAQGCHKDFGSWARMVTHSTVCLLWPLASLHRTLNPIDLTSAGVALSLRSSPLNGLQSAYRSL